MLVKLFNFPLKESRIPYCWKISSVVLIYKNAKKDQRQKNYCPESPLSAVSKVLEKIFSMMSGLPVIQLIF